ncbi:hypothetical protein SAMN02910456_00997 [Ruminococcaceae bacterium YRB3002]|nr:hypothetical protein SAMN02910456_00997 [Ruminococcaceae bacterium YRB3002]
MRIPLFVHKMTLSNQKVVFRSVNRWFFVTLENRPHFTFTPRQRERVICAASYSRKASATLASGLAPRQRERVICVASYSRKASATLASGLTAGAKRRGLKRASGREPILSIYPPSSPLHTPSLHRHRTPPDQTRFSREHAQTPYSQP